MNKEQIKQIDNHRRMNEIGGMLFGIRIGLFISNASNPVLDTFKIIFLAGRIVILVFEQRKWNKIKINNSNISSLIQLLFLVS